MSKEPAIGAVRVRSDGASNNTRIDVWTADGWQPLRFVQSATWGIDCHGVSELRLTAELASLDLLAPADQVLLRLVQSANADRVEPTLQDPSNLIYQYSENGDALLDLAEGDLTGHLKFAGDTANLDVGVTPAGSYRTDISRGLFQLGAAPTGPITCSTAPAPCRIGPAALHSPLAPPLTAEPPIATVTLERHADGTFTAHSPTTDGCAYGLAKGDLAGALKFALDHLGAAP